MLDFKFLINFLEKLLKTVAWLTVICMILLMPLTLPVRFVMLVVVVAGVTVAEELIRRKERKQ